MNCPHKKVVRATFRHGDPRLGLFEVFYYCAGCWLVIDKPDGTPYMTVSDLHRRQKSEKFPKLKFPGLKEGK